MRKAILFGINHNPISYVSPEALQRECDSKMYEYSTAPVVKSITLQQGDVYNITTGVLKRAKL